MSRHCSVTSQLLSTVLTPGQRALFTETGTLAKGIGSCEHSLNSALGNISILPGYENVKKQAMVSFVNKIYPEYNLSTKTLYITKQKMMLLLPHFNESSLGPQNEI